MQAYIDELAQTLMEGADDPSTSAHARLVELINANVCPFLPTRAEEADFKLLLVGRTIALPKHMWVHYVSGQTPHSRQSMQVSIVRRGTSRRSWQCSATGCTRPSERSR